MGRSWPGRETGRADGAQTPKTSVRVGWGRGGKRPHRVLLDPAASARIARR